ncbi:MAG: RnfABCDGE type electron transport complex subunit B, partial [Casimicrobiaceae bacterium]
CPVDAIVGGPKRMHTVLASLCTGCALCIPPCPVDCIDMPPALRGWTSADADAARARHVARDLRRAPSALIAEQPVHADRDAASRPDAARIGQRVAAALARARARRRAVA